MPGNQCSTTRCRENPACMRNGLRKTLRRTRFVVRRTRAVQSRVIRGKPGGAGSEEQKKGDTSERSLRLILTGTGEFWCRFYGAGFVGVGTQLLFMRAGVGRMFFFQRGFFLRLVRRVRQRVIERMMAGILKMTVPVHAGPFCRGRFIHRTFREWLSR